MRKYVRPVSAVALCAAILMLAPPLSIDAQQEGGGQGNGKLHRKAKKIPNSYIVVLDEDPTGAAGDFGEAAAAADRAIAKTRSGRVKDVYAYALRGVSADMTEEDAQLLADDPAVAYVEEDSEMEIVTTQTGATWGLDRIDQANRPLNGTYVYTTTGSGVNAYIIDTGIRTSHAQFGGRA